MTELCLSQSGASWQRRVGLHVQVFGIGRREADWMVDSDLQAYLDNIRRDLLLTKMAKRVSDPRSLPRSVPTGRPGRPLQGIRRCRLIRPAYGPWRSPLSDSSRLPGRVLGVCKDGAACRIESHLSACCPNPWKPLPSSPACSEKTRAVFDHVGLFMSRLAQRPLNQPTHTGCAQTVLRSGRFISRSVQIGLRSDCFIPKRADLLRSECFIPGVCSSR